MRPTVADSKNGVYVELNSTRCFCGGRKGSGKSFCWKCWCKLPVGIKRMLYNPVGYPATVAKAKDFLRARMPVSKGGSL